MEINNGLIKLGAKGGNFYNYLSSIFYILVDQLWLYRLFNWHQNNLDNLDTISHTKYKLTKIKPFIINNIRKI
ncbi:hypothetical protein HBA_0494 [Sodalis endosymbiont of Henestaris halophilus]|nr:hypothetical protein HBA_0494 [Sodalis endosymbiont of Henestaris halophilus]